MRLARVEISSWLAITVPHSCARTDSRKTSWSDSSMWPETTRKTCSPPVSGEAMGNAQHTGEASIVSRVTAVSPVSSSPAWSGARS